MYGWIGAFTAHAGKRDALIACLLDGAAKLPGCLNFIVAKDPADPALIWVTQVWENQAAHDSAHVSSAHDASRAEMAALIAAAAPIATTVPVGGVGLRA